MSRDFSRLPRALTGAVLSGLLLLAGGAHYVVVPGDTLSSIAARTGLSVAELAAANSIDDPNRLAVGASLRLPSQVGALRHHTHKVRPGERVDSIAASHGITVEQLEDANGILNGVIYAGTTLRLSGDGYLATAGAVSTHTVPTDDTLAHVASHHATTTHALAHANNLSEDTLVPAGTTLAVPERWRCPVTGARWFNDWGFPRSGGRSHAGTDLFAARGTPVVAPVTGTVEHIRGSVGGLQFTLRGDDGVTYLGSHMDSFGAEGRVTAGDVIGFVGDSGNAEGTDPHLHFQMHPGDGEAVNPYPSLVHNGC